MKNPIPASVLVLLCWFSPDLVRGQTFVVQGEPGLQGNQSELSCTDANCQVQGGLNLAGSLQVAGQLEGSRVSFAGTATPPEPSLNVDRLQIQLGATLPPCPMGYSQRQGEVGLLICERPVGNGMTDQIVGVGDFWIDRYEVSVWAAEDCTGLQFGSNAIDDYPDSFPDLGEWSQPLYACSLEGQAPAGSLTWLQAIQVCAQAGKGLCSNAMWQAAVAGSPEASCNTDTGSVALTGSRAACVSKRGAFDMVGNRSEWVSDWFIGGLWPTVADPYMPFNLDFIEDLLRGFAGRVCNQSVCDDPSDFLDRVPAAGLRGGSYEDGTDAGPFYFDVMSGLDRGAPSAGVRCCLRR